MHTYCAHLALYVARTHAQFLVIVKCAEHEQYLCKLITKMCAHVNRNFVRRERGGEREGEKRWRERGLEREGERGREGGREEENRERWGVRERGGGWGGGRGEREGERGNRGGGPPEMYTLPYPE